MGLIRRIEIQYFRSIYRLAFRPVGLNVLSGANDVGKSNILKSLNLFFNGDTDWGRELDFPQDYCSRRLEHVRRNTVKGKQLIKVAIEFNRPSNYSGSLPVTFIVRRTWLRDGKTETHNLESQERAGKLPSSLETARRFLVQFLNRVHFEYVPAVKDRAYFQHLLDRLQASLFETPLDTDSVIGKVTESLAQHVEKQIGNLKEDFGRATGLQTTIEPPTELSALFRAFGVSTAHPDRNVPLILRGDGIQARYVSSVLSYISNNSSNFFVWGFEEPENSLEYRYASELAKDFADTYTSDAQIFVTSHSPAFLSIDSEDASCFRVYRAEGSTVLDEARDVEDMSGHSQELKRELGILQIQRSVYRDYKERIKIYESEIRRYEEVIEEMRLRAMPVLLVEGVHDQEILQVAWERLFPDSGCPFLIRPADARGGESGGSAGAPSVAKMIEAGHPSDERSLVGLFDHDREGIRAYEKLTKSFVEDADAKIKRHVNGWSIGVLLPVPPDRQEYKDADNLSLEYYFSDDVLRRTLNGKGLILEDPSPKVLLNGKEVEVDDSQLTFLDLAGHQRIVSGKDVFAREIVPTLDRDYFANFEPLLGLIESLIRTD